MTSDADNDLDVAELQSLHSKAMAMANRQHQRCAQWHARLKPRTLTATMRCTYLDLNANAMQAIIKDIDSHEPVESDFLESIRGIDGSHPRHLIQLKRMANHFRTKRDAIASQLAKQAHEQKVKDFDNDRHHVKAYSKLSDNLTKPITFLKRDEVGPEGQQIGTFATQPAELDNILTRAWQRIYHGTSRPLQQVADDFCKKYEHLLFHAPEAACDEIDSEAFRASCLKASNSAGGLDGWHPVDFKLLSPLAFKFVVDLLNSIETGAPWPQGTLHGRLAFLAKDPSDAEEPGAYRPLLVLPHLYRRWAAFRLQCLPAWIQTWANESMFAGIPERGAEDAWWLTSVTIETWQAQQIQFSGSSADIAKCFDQIVRPLVYAVAKTAGMPKRILEPYSRYMESLQVRNTVGGGLGQPFARRCGIPQGCPLSMMFIALLLRPWTIMLDTMGAVPRILADDLMILTSGTQHLSKMQEAINCTHQLLRDMGAVVAPKKSFIFCSNARARKWYAAHTWPWEFITWYKSWQL